MFIDMNLKITEGGEMTATASAKHHYGVFGKTAAIISY